MPDAGDTFLLTGGRVPAPHLWVILWGPAGPANAYLAVMLTSVKAFSERTCILDVGDHPFIRHPTAVAYREVARWTGERLAQLTAEGVARPRQKMDETVLQRTREGFCRSPHLPNAFVEMAVNDFGAERPD